MRKYDLAKMLEEIRRDEGGGKEKAAKQVLTQAQIKAMARARPRRAPGRPAGK